MKHQLCRNCGSEVTGNYCSACGQRTNTHRLDWASLAESVTSTFIGDEAYGLRGINMRKGTVGTWLTILCQPHRAIPEYLAGNRRKYFNPVAILLLLSTFYAVVYALMGNTYTPRADDSQHLVIRLLYTYVDYASLHPAASMLLTLPFFALALKTVFRKKAGLKFVEYLYIGIFLSVFEITLMIVGLPGRKLLPEYHTFLALTLPSFLYTAFVLWKMFSLRKWSAVLRTLLVQALQYAYLLLSLILLMSASLTTYYLFSPETFKKANGSSTEIVVEEESTLNQFINAVIGLATPEHESDADETVSDKAAPDPVVDADGMPEADAPQTENASEKGERTAEKARKR